MKTEFLAFDTMPSNVSKILWAIFSNEMYYVQSCKMGKGKPRFNRNVVDKMENYISLWIRSKETTSGFYWNLTGSNYDINDYLIWAFLHSVKFVSVGSGFEVKRIAPELDHLRKMIISCKLLYVYIITEYVKFENTKPLWKFAFSATDGIIIAGKIHIIASHKNGVDIFFARYEIQWIRKCIDLFVWEGGCLGGEGMANIHILCVPKRILSYILFQRNDSWFMIYESWMIPSNDDIFFRLVFFSRMKQKMKRMMKYWRTGAEKW